jgi:adenylate kinase family enzyme
MKKVLILGCAGSGKSTFSKQLGQYKNIPVIHLDSLYWKSGWIASSEDEWDKTIEELLLRDSYIMDGNYSRTLNKRLVDADTVYFFDFPRFLCIYRVIKRRIMNHGTTREDMAEGCKENIDLEFLKWIWNFRKRSRSKILKTLAEIDGEKKVYIFRKPKDLREYRKTHMIANS